MPANHLAEAGLKAAGDGGILEKFFVQEHEFQLAYCDIAIKGTHARPNDKKY